MINDNKKIIAYLEPAIGNIFKILPLYEKGNFGLDVYVESLLFEFYGWNKSIAIGNSYEYISLLSNLESIKKVVREENKQPVVKREVFKCIDIIKTMVEKLEEGE